MGSDDIVTVNQRMDKTARIFAARFHTPCVVICEHKITVPCQNVDLGHITSVTRTHSVLKDNDTVLLRCIIAVKITAEYMSLGRLDGIRLLFQALKIVCIKIKYQSVLVSTRINFITDHFGNQGVKHQTPPSIIIPKG